MNAGRKIRLKSAMVEAARWSRLPTLLAPSFAGVGAIIAMHRVREASDDEFQPNLTLEITPAFLDRTISHIKELDLDIVSLDDMLRRLQTGDFDRRFVCLTLDDGYADNYIHGYPIFRAHQVPFSIYLTTGFLDGDALFWWLLLEEVIRRNDRISLNIEGKQEALPTARLAEKERAFELLQARFRGLSAKAVEAASLALASDHGIDPAAFCREHAMTWDMARGITVDGLGTIEAHTEKHLALSLQTENEIRAEMDSSCARIAEKTGRSPRHFAYPFGDVQAVTRREIDLVRKLSPASATTTRAGILKPQ
ncbi:MAG: polysaccharide deacetylase family protein, partial [Geminicoccaceae bacterium]